MNQELEQIVTTELDPLGFELVELKRGGSKGRPVVEVRVDRRDGQGVTVADCARASRAIEAKLDERPDLVGERYVLEVSSPGVERPLKRAGDWRRFNGQRASVRSDVLGGRRELQIAGVEGEEGQEVALLRDDKGNEVRVPLAEIKEARLVFEWKR